jgi:hypothetical protein
MPHRIRKCTNTLYGYAIIIKTYISWMYELKKMWRYLRVNLLGPGPRLMKKEFTGPRSQGWGTLMLDDFVLTAPNTDGLPQLELMENKIYIICYNQGFIWDVLGSVVYLSCKSTESYLPHFRKGMSLTLIRLNCSIFTESPNDHTLESKYSKILHFAIF